MVSSPVVDAVEGVMLNMGDLNVRKHRDAKNSDAGGVRSCVDESLQ